MPTSRSASATTGDQLTTSELQIALPDTLKANRSRARLLHRLVAYALSRGATEALLGVRGVLLAALLGPPAFGTWALLRLAMRYSALASLGVYRGVELELLRSGGEPATAHRDSPAAAALGFVLVVGATMAGLALAASFLVSDPTYRLLLRGFAAASMAESAYGYALVCTRVRANLRLYSLLETGTAVLHVLCALGLAMVWGLAGAFAGLTLANLFGIAAASRWVEMRPVLRLEPVRRLLHVGFPVALTMCVGLLLATADRWVVAAWGGPTLLGYYAFAASVTTAAGALAIVVRTVVFPQVYGEATATGPATALQAHLERALLPFARLLPPLLGALSLALGPLVAAAMPNYLQAIAPARLFLLAGVAIGLVNLASVGAIAAGRQRQLPAYALTALALTLVLSVLALASGQGLVAVAGATFAGHLLFAAAALRLNVREIGMPRAERFVMITLLPLVWCTLAVSVAGHLSPGADPRSAAIALAVYLLLLVPLLAAWRWERRRLRGPAPSGEGYSRN